MKFNCIFLHLFYSLGLFLQFKKYFENVSANILIIDFCPLSLLRDVLLVYVDVCQLFYNHFLLFGFVAEFTNCPFLLVLLLYLVLIFAGFFLFCVSLTLNHFSNFSSLDLTSFKLSAHRLPHCSAG